VNRLRDEIRALGPALDLDKKAAAFDALIRVLISTRKAQLSAPSAVARSQGRPHDPGRLELFQVLQEALRDHLPLPWIAADHGPESRAEAEHEDPAIRAFLNLIEKEIEAGRGVEEIPDDVARRMLEHAALDIDLDEPIEGDVDLRTLRSAGNKTDPYTVFARMLAQGSPPDDWASLLARSAPSP